MSFNQALQFVLEREGGYVNDPSDPGGETKYGISHRSYPQLDIKALTPEQAGALYESDYWRPAGCEDLAPDMALVVFDTAVNCGVQQAVLWEEQYHGRDDFLWRRLTYYRTLVQKRPILTKFLTGWIRRLELLRDAAPLMVA